jgi:uncharacterized protein
MPSLAIAVFVKTPGLSAIKTRLAKDIGKHAALEFYISSLSQTLDLLNNFKGAGVCDVTAYWAVAEAQAMGHIMWKSLPNVLQQGEGLGERMAHVYNHLLTGAEAVMLLGADCPHLPVEYLKTAAKVLFDGPEEHVLGPAADGGFYLFASKKKFPKRAWVNASYSSPNTRDEFMSSLGLNPQNCFLLPELFDIDTGDDYDRLNASEAKS